MLKADVKCSFTITIAVWRFSCHVPGCKLEHNAKMIETRRNLESIAVLFKMYSKLRNII